MEGTQAAAGAGGATDGRMQALEAALGAIRRQYGQGAVVRMGDSMVGPGIQSVPTGSIGLDLALGIGGLPRGRIVEIYGPEAAGKTSLSLHAIAEAQKAGGIAAFIDAEHALDPSYASAIGVDVDGLYVSQPDSGEQALEICEHLVRSGAVDCVVVDSVAALVPKAEIDGEMGDAHVGLQARLMSQAMRKLASVVDRTGCLVIFINQLREKVGIMFGNPEVTCGGRALKFYASVRIDVRRKDKVTAGGVAIGSHTVAKVVKNKVAPPFRQAEFDIIFGKGIDTASELLDLGAAKGVVEKSGSWYAYRGEKMPQGRAAAADFLRSRPDLMEGIRCGLLGGPADAEAAHGEEAGEGGAQAGAGAGGP